VEAAQAYLQHRQKEHPEELKAEQAPSVFQRYKVKSGEGGLAFMMAHKPVYDASTGNLKSFSWARKDEDLGADKKKTEIALNTPWRSRHVV
jgi:hypothetical protein